MFETMYAAPGIGLAAVQIGILKRIIVVDVSKKDEEKKPIFLINPKIIFKSKETSLFEEGCLSLPGYFAEIERPAKCKVEYIDYNGKQTELEAEGLLSTCIQHEVDHLNGVLFVEAPAMLPPKNSNRLGRLRALGRDAMTLAQHWAQIETTEQWVLRGETGFLRRRPDGSIERALELATFDGAEVQPLRLR